MMCNGLNWHKLGIGGWPFKCVNQNFASKKEGRFPYGGDINRF